MTLKQYQSIKALMRYNNKYLILEAAKFEGAKYEIPGGRKTSAHETDESTLRREVAEETGILEFKILKEIDQWSITLPTLGMHIDGKTYLCETDKDTVELSDEHLAYEWVTLENIKTLETPDWLKESVSKL